MTRASAHLPLIRSPPLPRAGPDVKRRKMLTKKMEPLSLFLFVLVPHSISLGRCLDVSVSVCWTSGDGGREGNVWLDDVALRPVGQADTVASLTLYPAVEHALTLRHRGSVQTWTVTVSPRTKSIKIRGRQKPSKHPTNATQDILRLFDPAEVFACESNTLFFHQDENFLLATGHTTRLPVRLSSRSASMLLVSWMGIGPDVNYSHAVTLYHTELGSYNALSTDTTTRSHYRFTALDSCSPYVACVQIAGTRSFTCLSTITDPDIPQDFEVSSWNISSISLTWNCPENRKYSLFLLTVFYLNGTDHVTVEEPLWHREDGFAFTLPDLQPCSRVKFGLQTVCLAGLESRYSKMVLNDGNSVHSNIQTLHQISFGPDNYTLRWEVRNTSSISMFRIYHDEVLQGTTLLTNFTVGGLLPCREYQAKVEALCGESVLMSSRAVTVHTGPRGVSELKFHSNSSTARWLPGTTQRSAFLSELSLENGGTVQSRRLMDTELHLPGLEEGKMYVLDVWEECDGQWESEHSSLSIEGANPPLQLPVRAAGPHQALELQSDFTSMGLTVVLPWSLPDDLLDDASEPRAKVEKMFKDQLQELLKAFGEPARVELVTIVPTDEPNKTEILFMSFNASNTEEDVPLSVQDQLDYLHSLNTTNMTVADGILLWNGPDHCASSGHTLCPVYSLCINTLDSYVCVCQRGYYDVSSVIKPPVATHPLCKEKGLFSQCVDKLMTGGIAKLYLTSYIGGEVDAMLNDGRCSMGETGNIYHFHTSRNSSECGTERRVNKTHIVFQNSMSVTSTEEQPISRRNLKVVWKCVYPRHHVRRVQVSVDDKWSTSLSLVELNPLPQPALTMMLFRDSSYVQQYTDAVHLGSEDTLFFQVALQTNGSFAADVLLQVESCWATESTNPQDTIQGVFLQDGCPVDNTFHWLSVNGLEQSSRFSIHMFTMPKGLPLYFHCVTNVCGRDEDCTQNCTSEQRTKRSVNLRKRAAVVSAGPLVVSTRVKTADGVHPTSWTEYMMMILTVVGSIGILGVTMLSVSAAKAVMNYYEQLRQQ